MRVLKYDKMLEAIFERLNEVDGVSYPPRTLLETEEIHNRLDAFAEKCGADNDNDLYDEFIDIVFGYNREAFNMGIKTALSFILQEDLHGAGDTKESSKK